MNSWLTPIWIACLVCQGLLDHLKTTLLPSYLPLCMYGLLYYLSQGHLSKQITVHDPLWHETTQLLLMAFPTSMFTDTPLNGIVRFSSKVSVIPVKRYFFAQKKGGTRKGPWNTLVSVVYCLLVQERSFGFIAGFFKGSRKRPKFWNSFRTVSFTSIQHLHSSWAEVRPRT